MPAAINGNMRRTIIMSNYQQIRTNDILNGEGLRTTIFFTFCEFYCKDCFNKGLSE